MRAEFLKMHGAGNDFVVFDERASPLELTPTRVAALADRHRGIGCDQLIRLQPPTDPRAIVRMAIHNPDGSASGTCGNATRCIATLLEPGAVIETLGGLLPTRRLTDGRIEADMGPPVLDPAAIPLEGHADSLHLPLPVDAAACSMGNPHATVFVADVNAIDVAARGREFERHPLFPAGANIGFATVLDRETIRLRVFERGAGLTLACGSGACATLVNAHRRGLTDRAARLVLDGGTLAIHWRETDNHVLMTGPAATSFRGTVELEDFPA